MSGHIDSGIGSNSAGQFSASSGSNRKSDNLVKACRTGQLFTVRRIIKEEHLDPNFHVESNHHKDTPLHIAALHGSKEVVKYLVENSGCDAESKNGHGKTPLHCAANQGHLDIVKYLIEERKCNPMSVCNWNRTPLHNACKHGRFGVVKYLLSLTNVNAFVRDTKHKSTPVHMAAEFGSLDVVKYMNETCQKQPLEENTYTVLHTAAFGGKLDIVQYLVLEGYDPMAKGKLGRSPLFSACAGGRLDIVKYLLDECKVERPTDEHSSHLGIAAKNGALDVVAYLVAEKDWAVQHGPLLNSALHQAASAGQLAVVKFFIDGNHCSPSCVGKRGRTLLHSACISGKMDVVDYLINTCEVDTSAKDHHNQATPLHLAAKEGHFRLVKRLIRKFNCDPCAKDINGKTALDYTTREDIKTFLSRSMKSFLGTQFQKLMEFKMHCTLTGAKLGDGAFSTVIELKMPDGQIVAGKIMKSMSEAAKSKLSDEIDVMLRLHHRNIITFKGIWIHGETSELPILVMEKMMMSLHAYLLDNSNLSVEKKVSFLLDTARGLDYLHNCTPAIIHRDLTAKNVLLDSQLTAKISDFGNSRNMDLDPEATLETLTAVPGTRDYMPPEAQGSSVIYDPSLDVFSFGHLALFTVIQTSCKQLLPASYTDSFGLHARSEVKRREQFLEPAAELLVDTQSLLKAIKQCLHNAPAQRPRTGELVKILSEIMNTFKVGDETTPMSEYVDALSKRVTCEMTESPSGINITLDPDVPGNVEVLEERKHPTEKKAVEGNVFPAIREANIIGQTKVEIDPNEPLNFHWKEHGFRVHIPAGTIDPGTGPMTLSIQASLSGNYELPDGLVPVSGIYWLSLYPYVNRFQEDVTITIQHCASVGDDPRLSFVTAKCTQKTLPYAFKSLSGLFTNTDSTLLVRSFSAYGVAGSRKSDYAFCLYYSKQLKNGFKALITVTPNLELQLKSVKNEFGDKEYADSVSAYVKEEAVSLDIQPDVGIPDSAWENEGWELFPAVTPTLQKECLDDYEPGKIIPHFSIGIRLKNASQCQPLKQKVNFIGVQPPTFIIISRDPLTFYESSEGNGTVTSTDQGTGVKEQQKLSAMPRLAELMIMHTQEEGSIAIINTIAPEWQKVCTLLDFDPIGDKLQQIEMDKGRHGVKACCQEMLQHWLRGNGRQQPASWALLLKILEDCDFNNLVSQIRRNL